MKTAAELEVEVWVGGAEGWNALGRRCLPFQASLFLTLF